MIRSRFLKTGSFALLLTFFVLIGQVTPAMAFDNCRQRIEKAERQLHEAERRHGEHSRQAEEKRRHLEEVRERCRDRH